MISYLSYKIYYLFSKNCVEVHCSIIVFVFIYILFYFVYFTTKNYVQISYDNTTQKCDKILNTFFHITFI